jgi:hypothetical protein
MALIAPEQIELFGEAVSRPQCSDDLSSFMQTVAPIADQIIDNLRKATFRIDPICGPHFSRLHSILSSVQKRHGRILEVALREGLKESSAHTIWTEQRFAISVAADNLVNSQNETACRQSELPYGEIYRTVQIDVGSFRPTAETIISYELKRANGLHDAGKIRSMRRDLACTRLLLKSYGRTRGFDASNSDALIIFYYGRRSIPAPLSLIGDELDEHFAFPIRARIETANDYYRKQVLTMLESI